MFSLRTSPYAAASILPVEASAHERTRASNRYAAIAAALLWLVPAIYPLQSVAAAQAGKPASPTAVPRLGDDVPTPLLKRASSTKPCPVGDGHFDPCSTLTAGRDKVTVGWDATTHRVTFLYSTTLDTDNDIRVGDVLEIDSDSPITSYPAPGEPHRFVTSDWCDTDDSLTGDAEWCAVMVPTRPRSGRVVGFVQSLYLYIRDFDPEPMHRTASPRDTAQPKVLRTTLRRRR